MDIQHIFNQLDYDSGIKRTQSKKKDPLHTSSAKSFSETIKQTDKRDEYIASTKESFSLLSDTYEDLKKVSEKTERSSTKSDIVVKSDGSRVLVITTKVGGMETQMSIEISKPTDFPNAQGQNDEENKDTKGTREDEENKDTESTM